MFNRIFLFIFQILKRKKGRNYFLSPFSPKRSTAVCGERRPTILESSLDFTCPQKLAGKGFTVWMGWVLEHGTKFWAFLGPTRSCLSTSRSLTAGFHGMGVLPSVVRQGEGLSGLKMGGNERYLPSKRPPKEEHPGPPLNHKRRGSVAGLFWDSTNLKRENTVGSNLGSNIVFFREFLDHFNGIR